MSYPVDMESVKNTKLFKKFMESKNKSISISEPKMQNVDINIKFQSRQIESQSIAQKQSTQKTSFNKYNSSPRVHQRQFEYSNLKVAETSYPKQIYEASNINNGENVYEKQRQELVKQDNYTYENLQRKTEPMNRQKAYSKDKLNFEKKYEKLSEQYNELKEKVSVQRKEYRKEMIKLEEQAEMLNKKVFELRSKEDELILENKRLKEKSLAETKQRQAFQQSNRQLSFQVQQLKDMLDGQSNSSKKKQDETSHWRKINDDLRQKIRQLQSQISKHKDLSNMMERQKFVMEKQVSNKQLHLNEMREKINSLITQNGVLRDQIFHITSKLYQFQQQNKSLKADLRRHSDDFPMSYLQQKLQQASRFSRPQQQGLSSSFQQNKSEVIHDGGEKRTQRRRGEFARQRGMRRVEQNQEQKQMNTSSVQQNIAPTNMTHNSKQIGQAVRKLEQLNQELQKLKDSKAMNGTMRRQKINLQREIQEIQEFLKNKQ